MPSPPPVVPSIIHGGIIATTPPPRAESHWITFVFIGLVGYLLGKG